MTLLRASDVRFVRASRDLVAPFSFALRAGDEYQLEQPSAFAAALAARLCAAIVKPTTGSVVACDFESRLQAPEAKRRIGFVDGDGFEGDAHAFACQVAFHADVWGIPHERARRRASDALDALGEATPYARAIALALVPEVSLAILDRPTTASATAVRALLPAAGIVCVRTRDVADAS
ncbi:MAG: hypothetical protein NVS2B3_03400 [Vulcanimicrobiaceae bacterium]